MALTKMKLASIIGMLGALDDTVAVLGRTGVFQPDEAAEFFSNSEGLIPINSTNEYAPMLDRMKELLAGAGIKPKIVDAPEYDSMTIDEARSFIQDADSELGELISARDNLRAEVAVCDANIEKAKRFIGLDLDVGQVEECEFIITRFGRLPKDSYIKLQSYSENPYIEFFPCSHDDAYYWGVYVTPIDEADNIDRIFSRLYFEKLDISDINGKPAALSVRKL